MIDNVRFPNPFPPPFASAWGDDEFGLWVDFSLPASEHSESVSQRLRWIEAGTFLMGSPDDEPERLENEGPQHEVTISQGFWLADTACTQALWLAGMGGENPSRFQDDLNQPVENISWNNVQEFLNRLQTLLPGCQVDLPSEAEWEYACRAGTTRPFSFGANISPQQVNYDGNYAYPGGLKGEYREKTVPVKSLPTNPWGLYEMHGNVWERCKDGQRSYDQQAQIDPLGPIAGDDFPVVIRGGSWRLSAVWARSAFRLASHPGFVDRYLGFRVCLRSIEFGQEQVGPAGSPGRASGVNP
jgi:sulfatase modifying factor 1